MSTFTVSLPEYKQKYSFDKDHFLTLFPGSLFSTMLSITSDTDIELSQPFLIPQAMEVLQAIMDRKEIPVIYRSHSPGIRQSGDYLNIDLLAIIGDPSWPDFIAAGYTIFNLEDKDEKTIMTMFKFAVNTNYLSLVDYILIKCPVLSFETCEVLNTAIHKGYLSIVSRLLRDPRIPLDNRRPSTNPMYVEYLGTALHHAVSRYITGNPEALNLLLQCPRVETSLGFNTLLNLITSNKDWEMSKRIIRHPKTNPNFVLLPIICTRNVDLLRFVLDDPRIQMRCVLAAKDPALALIIDYEEYENVSRVLSEWITEHS